MDALVSGIASIVAEHISNCSTMLTQRDWNYTIDTSTSMIEILPLCLAPSEPRIMPVFPSLLIAFVHVMGDEQADDQSAVSVDIVRLIQRAQRGDRDAVGMLYQLHIDKIYRYIVRRVPTIQDAEDLAAEVFVNMVEGLSSYTVTGAPFEAWLYRIAAARVIDYYRRNKKQIDDLSDNFPDDELQPESVLLQTQDVNFLRHALQQLPDEQQTILILRFVERKSHDEVALMLGKSVTAIKSAQHRALSRLTELLGESHKVRHYLRGAHE